MHATVTTGQQSRHGRKEGRIEGQDVGCPFVRSADPTLARSTFRPVGVGGGAPPPPPLPSKRSRVAVNRSGIARRLVRVPKIPNLPMLVLARLASSNFVFRAEVFTLHAPFG